MIILEQDRLDYRFPEVHEEARFSITFQRTLRIPDDGTDYPLPPGLGNFPLRHLDDFTQHLPEAWARRGGVLMPMHQAEAMWIDFRATDYPFAVKVATGKICALTGDPWTEHLNRDPQDYLVLPDQPWLDGYCVDEGVIRQFVAMRMGEGFTAEEQLTGLAEHGGIQVVAYPMKAARYEAIRSVQPLALEAPDAAPTAPMGVAPGGRMRQAIYDDTYGLDAWDQRHCSRCFVTIANAGQWRAITGERPPTKPPTAKEYTAAGMPWFDYYGEGKAVSATDKLKALVGRGKSGQAPQPDNEPVAVDHVVPLGKGPRRVRECS